MLDRVIVRPYNNHIKTECRLVRLDRLLWEHEIAGSNPAIPTIKLEGLPAT